MDEPPLLCDYPPHPWTQLDHLCGDLLAIAPTLYRMHLDQVDWDKREPEHKDFETNVPNYEGQNEDNKSIFNEDTMPDTEVDSLGARSDHQKDDDKGVDGLDDLSSGSDTLPDAESDAELSNGVDN